MTTELQTVIDTGDLRRYRTELPNMCDDELDPYQYRLYAHYKRWCGANGGTTTESVRRTAETCRMSATKVIETRRWLHENGWIALHQDAETGGYIVQIIDRWPENFVRYASRSVPNMERTVPNMEHPRSKYGTHKKELYKKELLEGTVVGAAPPPPPAAPSNDDDQPGFWEEPAQPPAPPPAPTPTVRTLTQQPPIAMYRDAFLHYPSKPQMALIMAHGVTDLRRWKDVLAFWVGRGYSLTNVAGMLDLYDHPERIAERTAPRPTQTAATRPSQQVGDGWDEFVAANTNAQFSPEVIAATDAFIASVLAGAD